MYISRGFSHGIPSPVTEVGRIFFLFSFLSSVSFFLVFPFFFIISHQSENRTNDYWVSKRSTRREFIFRFPRRINCNRSQRPITSRIFILIDEHVKRWADIHRQFYFSWTFFLIFTNTCKLANFTERNGGFNFYAANGLHVPAGDCVTVNESFLILKRIVDSSLQRFRKKRM